MWGKGISTVAFPRFQQAVCHRFQRLGPGQFAPAVTHTLHRRPQAIRVVVNILQGYRLGTNMPTAERIGLVTLYGDYFLTSGGDLQPADGLAQVTGAIMHRLTHKLALPCRELPSLSSSYHQSPANPRGAV